jgi:hypothetical protein
MHGDEPKDHGVFARNDKLGHYLWRSIAGLTQICKGGGSQIVYNPSDERTHDGG